MNGCVKHCLYGKKASLGEISRQILFDSVFSLATQDEKPLFGSLWLDQLKTYIGNC